VNSRIVRSLLVALVLAAGVQLPAGAQTAEQLEAFQSLPPAQQQEILRQMGDRQGGEADSGLAPAMPTAVARGDQVAGRLLDVPEQIPRLRGGDTVLLELDVPDEDDRARIEFRQRVLAGNPYRLNRVGQLMLHDGTTLALAGLTANEAVARINADPQLEGFGFRLRMLPVEPVLRPFGYDLFANVPTTFAPATDIPVPADYVVGPGDTLEVQLIGQRGGQFTLTVGRDGVVDFPELGPIAVAGMRFASVKDLLEQRVAEQMIGMRANVSIGALRSIQVFVLGEAAQPGSYTVSGLSTITNALFASGGVTPIGSLRNIQLKRSGQVVKQLDLYDLLLNGDTSNDARLLPGDVIFIPPVGITAAITGEVRRAAIYELEEGAQASQLLYLAGGLMPEADPRTARLERIDQRRNRTVVDLDLSSPQGRATRVQTGDVLRVQAIRDSLEGAVSLEGHVHRGGGVQFHAGMRLTDVIGSLDELRPGADLHYALIRRESGPTRKVSAISADLAAAFADPRSAANVVLEARDRIHVFDMATSRDRVIAPILADLNRQSGRDQPLQAVAVGGRVKVPGQYPLEPGMRVSDLIRAGGSLDQAAYGGTAELARYEVIDGERRQTEVIPIDLKQILAGDTPSNLLLRPFDFLVIKEMPEWRDLETVDLVGEVRFPGRYPVRRGETLRTVIERAGGLTELAFVQGSVFTRRDLKEREQKQLQVLADRLQRELASMSLQQSQQSEDATQAMTAGRALLADLQGTEAVGRLVIHLDRLMAGAPGSPDDVVLRDGDRLVIPRTTQEVTVLGEVQSPTSHLYQANLSRKDYIARSGGTTQRADERRIYVVRANGAVETGSSSNWFSSGSGVEIRPGDTVVVPLDAQRMRPLTVWTSVTQILFNIAIAVAAVNSF
jgi:polysaccharide biosynthesis/export protein